MMKIVLDSTNKKTFQERSAYRVDDMNIGEMTLTELRGLIGFMVFGETLKHTSQAMTDLHSQTELFRTEYQCCFSTPRHQWLLNMLRFDSISTREQHRRERKLAPIKEISNLFFLNCQKQFIPGYYTCIDEQLFGFRGGCSFKPTCQ